MIIEFYVSKPHIFKVKSEKQAVWPNVFVIVYLLVASCAIFVKNNFPKQPRSLFLPFW